MYYLYILKCKDQSLYTGITTDITRRVKEHNTGKGGKYTRSKRPVKLVFSEEYKDRLKAQVREAEIKSWNRAKKMQLIQK
ncbi:MAG: GIY-YIG nuclease family protein [Candidatus Omnitrophica bacterium]|nr:GIY-YIG nuclease family protein [Candidatus Omnitrophota bacterium]